MKITGSTYENGRITLHGRIKCPDAGIDISAAHCSEYCCSHFEAKQIKRGGELSVWCKYEK